VRTANITFADDRYLVECVHVRSRDKTDFDCIRENHKFLWDDDDNDTSW